MNKFFTILLVCLTGIGYAQNSQLKLWYEQPSGEVWTDALPIGNGRLGAMVYGNVEQELIRLNEHTVWSGGPNRNDNPDALNALPEIRKLIFEGKQKEAELLASKTVESKKSNGQKFEPVGDLIIDFPGHEKFTDYRRELDIEQAITKVRYMVDGVTYTREVIASLTDEVIAIRLSASESGKVSFISAFDTPQPNAAISTNSAKDLMLTGTTTDHEGVRGQVKFTALARIKTKGG